MCLRWEWCVSILQSRISARHNGMERTSTLGSSSRGWKMECGSHESRTKDKNKPCSGSVATVLVCPSHVPQFGVKNQSVQIPSCVSIKLNALRLHTACSCNARRSFELLLWLFENSSSLALCAEPAWDCRQYKLWPGQVNVHRCWCGASPCNPLSSAFSHGTLLWVLHDARDFLATQFVASSPRT